MQNKDTQFQAKQKPANLVVRGRKSSTNLPRYMLSKQKAGGIYYYSSVVVNGQRRQIPLGQNLDLALAQHDEHVRGSMPNAILPRIKTPAMEYAKTMYKKLTSNAKVRNIFVGITLEDVEGMLERSGFRCELTGIHFDMQKKSNYRIRPWIPSIDRIDSSKGYTMQNCRVVCASVNSALGQYGEEVLLKIAKMMIEKRNQTLRERRRSDELQ